MRTNANLFRCAVERCSTVIEKKCNLPILRHILLAVEPGRLTMTATNLDDYFQIALPAQSDVTMTLAVDAASLLALVKQSGTGEVLMAYDPETQRCAAAIGDVSISIPTADPAEFPAMPEFSPQRPGVDVTIGDQEQYLRLLKTLAPFCTNPNENRAYSGILTNQQDDGVHVVSTDIHRLNVVIMKTGSAPAPFVMSRSLCDTLVKTFGDIPIQSFRLLGDGVTDPNQQPFTPAHVLVSGDNQWLLARLLKNEFPHHLHVLDRSRIKTRYIEVDRKQLTQKMKGFCDLLKDKYVATTLEYLDGKLFVSVHGDESQTMETELPATPIGIDPDDPCITGMNGRYLLQALRSFRQEKVRLSIDSGVRPIYLIEGSEEERHYNLTMPLRTELKSRRELALAKAA